MAVFFSKEQKSMCGFFLNLGVWQSLRTFSSCREGDACRKQNPHSPGVGGSGRCCCPEIRSVHAGFYVGTCGVRARRRLALVHVSTGLGTMLFGVSGNCEDREVTSLPDEFGKEPDSEKDTSCWKAG